MNLDPYFALVKASAEASQEFPPLAITRPNSPSSEPPAEATYSDLTLFHNLVPKPSKKRYLADVLEPMSMYGATSGIIDMWNRLLQDHAKEPGDRLSATDYTIVEAVSPYYILRPTSISAWFITEPGLAGRNNPSGESRLTTGIALCLEDRSVTSKTHGTEFHIYYCRLGTPSFVREGTPSTQPRSTSSLKGTSLVPLLPSALSSLSLTTILAKRDATSVFSQTHLVSEWSQGIPT
jgi:hypothetical protein